MRYVVAVKREARGQWTESLSEFLTRIPGAGNILSSPDSPRVQVDLTTEGVQRLQEVAGHMLHIEPLIPHKTFVPSS